MTDAEVAAFGRVFGSVPGHTEATHQRFHQRLFPPGCGADSMTAETSAVLAMTEQQGRSAAPEADRIVVCRVIARDWAVARNIAALASSAAAWSGGD